MISFLKKAALLTVFCSFFVSISSWAQFGNMNNAFKMVNNYQKAKDKGKSTKSYLGYSIGAGIPFTTAKFEHRYTEYSSQIIDSKPVETIVGEKVITRNPKVSGIHFTGNTYYRLAELTENSILAFNFGAVAYVLNYDIGEISIDKRATYTYQTTSLQIGIPLCLDYKYGGEAIYNKSQKTSFTLGVGVAPILYGNNFGPIQNTRTDIRPFLRAELGIFAGVNWRLSGSVLAGSAKTMDIKTDGDFYLGRSAHISLNSTPTYSISLSVMPFSYDWESFGW